MKLLSNTVINFHAVEDRDWFEKVLQLLQKNYNLISILDLEKFYFNEKIIHNACHITFDDGDLSFYYNVYPILQKYEIPATMFVSPQRIIKNDNFWFQEIRGYDQAILANIIRADGSVIPDDVKQTQLIASLKNLTIEQIWQVIREYQRKTGVKPKTRQNIDVSELQKIHEEGLVIIGAHTLNHPILANEAAETSRYEISSSIKDLGDILDSPIVYFAYPNGIPGLDYGMREMEFLKENGINLAFSTQSKGFTKSDNILEIPRKGLSHGGSAFVVFKLILGHRWELTKRIVKGRQEENYRIKRIDRDDK